MALRVIGECVDYTERPYDMADRENPGQRIRGVTRVARVQTSRRDFIDVRFPETWAQDGNAWPYDGQELDLVVEARANGGNVKINAVRPNVAPAVPSPRGSRAAVPESVSS